MEFVTNKKTTSLIVPEGVKGWGWETLRKSLSLMSECYFLFVNGIEKVEVVMMNKGGYGMV